MKKLLPYVLLFFCSLVQSQILFEKGYFIDESDRRVDCYIKNMDWKNNPTEFDYKLTLEDSQNKTAKIETIKEFGIDNFSKYKRFSIDIERSASEMTHLTQNRYPEWKKEVLFLKYLIEGTANLYVYVDNNLIKYFYDTPNTPTQQLVSIKYIESENYTNYNNQFRQQLFANVNCEKMSMKDLKYIKYEKRSLISHFLKYNNCQSGEIVNYESKKSAPTFSLKAIVSANMTTLKITDPSTAYNLNTEMKKIIFKIGVELEYFLPFNKNTWSLYINPMYNKFEMVKNFSRTDGLVNGGNIINHTATVDYSSIEVPVGVRYHFYLKNDSKIFVNAAYGFDFNTASSITYDNTQNYINAKEKLDIHSGYFLSFGAGYSYKKFSAEARINTTRDLVENKRLYWSAKYSSLSVVLGYRFL